MVTVTPERRMLVETAERLAREQFTERAFTWGDEAPWEHVEALADQGFMGLNFDEAYGGGGLSELDALLLIEAVGRVCPDTGYFVMDQQFLAPRAIHEFGTEAAKERYLPPVCAGEDRIAICMSEPQAGSDLKAMRTVVRKEGGSLVLDGEKIWVSSVPHCSAGVVWTRFEDEGFGTVVVEFDWEGVEVQQHYRNMAGHHQTQFHMHEVRVPEENVLTRGPEGFRRNLQSLNWERVGNAAASNAFARCALEHALDYADEREQFGQPIGEFQGIQWKLADLATSLEASRSLTLRAAEDAEAAGRVPDPLTATMAKLRANEMVERVVSESLQVHGANGYQQGHPLEYLHRFARGQRLAAGTDEIARNTIGKLLRKDGLPSLV